MNEPKKLLCIFAHPDDETLGMGPAIAKYAANGVEVSLITATRGERGWFGDPAANPGLAALGSIRTAELQAAAQKLGIARVDFLDVIDGEVDQADPAPLVAKIVRLIRQIRPQVVVSFGPDGDYGHPDHIAISQITGAALLCAADPEFQPDSGQQHRVLKYYYMITGEKMAKTFLDRGLKIEMEVEGIARTTVAWPEWAITTRVRAAEFLPLVHEAVLCHKTQLPSLPNFDELPMSVFTEFMGELNFYRAYSLVNRACEREDDLFQGINDRSFR